MGLSKKSLYSLAAVAAICTSAHADVLYSQFPSSPGQNGIQVDAATGSYMQSIPSLAGATLDKIVWWGYHGSNSQGSGSDNFSVLLGSVAVTGSLLTSVEPSNQFITKYVLDIADQAVNFSTFTLINDSSDVEWFWQIAADQTGVADPENEPKVAFQLEGVRTPVNQVPEPGMLGLLGLAALAVARAARKQS